jgi:hypothetical protein
VDVDGDCHDDVPVGVDATGSAPLGFKMLLLVDAGIPTARAAEIARYVSRLYAPLQIKAEIRSRRVDVVGDDVRDLIVQSKRLIGGRPPTGFDVVHLITAVDLQSRGDDSSIGLADCIGGVRIPDRAFSVSEISPFVRTLTLGPVTGSGDEEARSVAHEVGHLLGARHVHANCAQGAPRPKNTDTPCTIMFLAAPSTDNFGVLERGVIRSYVSAYAG